MHGDVITPLRDLITSQDEEFNQIVFEGKVMVQNLYETDSVVKEKILKYFKGAKEVEEYLGRYMTVKDKSDVGFRQKEHLYKNIQGNLKRTREFESEYKDIVSKANTFIAKFIDKIDDFTKNIKKLEQVRVEAVHSAINKFVVYEKFSEMNNKYDIGNFSKILDEFKDDKEMEMIDQKIIDPNGVDPRTFKYSFSSYVSDQLELEKLNFENIEPPQRTSPEKEPQGGQKKSDIFDMFNYVMNIDSKLAP
jgi:hypothetical protein